MKRVAGLVSLVLLLTACGEQGLLDGVGDRTESFVNGSTTTTVALPAVAAGQVGEAVVSARDVLWFNDGKDPQFTGEAIDVVGAVWRGRAGSSRFVQSSRAEIAAALPGIMFPSTVPEQVRWITSQLVYQADQGTLDPDTSAAFGLWSTDPYQSETGRIGVLRVGPAATDAPASRSEIVPTSVPQGLSLAWTEASMRYELFCGSEISDELCYEVAASSVELAELLPGA
jgi:hypothetical protein